MPEYEISELSLGNGVLGISPIPGRTGRYDSDLTAILQWDAGLVLTTHNPNKDVAGKQTMSCSTSNL